MYLFFCDRFYPATDPLLQAGNRAFRYGEGVFETLKVVDGQIFFAEAHFARLQQAMDCLHLPAPCLFTPALLTQHITRLLQKNGHTRAARVRLTVWRGNGGLYEIEEKGCSYCIESFALDEPAYTLNENGLVTGVYSEARKTGDAVSNFKTANHLVYAMAARHAKANRLNDCLVLNTTGHVCDSTLANIFIVKNGELFTPPLSEGCVAGIMRQYLLAQLPAAGFTVTTQPLTPEAVQAADELFTTNVIKGIRWVATLDDHHYNNELTRTIFSRLLATL